MAYKLTEQTGKFKNGLISKNGYIRCMHGIHKILWEYCDLIRGKNIGSISIGDGILTLTTKDGIKLSCSREDERSPAMEILNFGDYESEEIRMLRKFIRKDSVVLDIGANVGWHSLNLAGHMPHGRIIAFEPAPGIVNYLKKNLKLNKIRNVEAKNYGLSDKSGTLELYYDPKLTVATSARNLYGESGKKKIRCRVRRLDDFILKTTSRIDLIKCDVEGAELFVIKGALNTLRKTKPVLFLEMLRKWSGKFGYHPNDLMRLLESIGYRCYYARSGKLIRTRKVTDSTKATNFYFLDPVKHAKFIKELA